MVGSLEILKAIPDRTERFRRSTDLYVALARDAGFQATAYSSPELPHFAALGSVEQERAIHALTTALEVFEEALSAQASLRDSPQLVWRCVRRLGFVPEGDVFDKIGKDDHFEIYSTDQMLLFWSLGVLEMLSFTIEQLFCLSWQQLTRRPDWASKQIFESAVRIVSGEERKTLALEIPEHEIEEVGTEKALRSHVRVKYMSPLWQGGELAGLLVIVGARPAGARA